MKLKMYQQTMAVTAPRSRNQRYGIGKCMAKTDFVYLTELPVTEPLSVLQAALAYFEEMEYFKALSVTYLADHVSGFYSVRFTVAGETLLPEELTLDTDDFEELGEAYTAQ